LGGKNSFDHIGLFNLGEKSFLRIFGEFNYTNNKSVIGLNKSTITFVNAQINFASNFRGNVKTDIYLSDANSALILEGDVNFVNGLRAEGAGQIKSNFGVVTFSGENTVIKNTFTIDKGTVIFLDHQSTVSVLNINNGASLSLSRNSPFVKRGTRMGTEGDFAVAVFPHGEIADQARNDEESNSPFPKRGTRMGTEGDFAVEPVILRERAESLNNLPITVRGSSFLQQSGENQSLIDSAHSRRMTGGFVPSPLVQEGKGSSLSDINSLYILSSFVLSGTLSLDFDLIHSSSDFISVLGTLTIKPTVLYANLISIPTISGSSVAFMSATKIVGYRNLIFAEPVQHLHIRLSENKLWLLYYKPDNYWNDFVEIYKTATILVDAKQNITAQVGDNAFEEAYGGYDNFIVKGYGYKLDSNGVKNLGFVLNNSSQTFDNIVFSSFTSTQNGGVFSAVDSQINFTSTIKFENSLAAFGGAIFLNQSLANFQNSRATFINNAATYEGGAIALYNGSTLSFENSKVTFANNKVGGADSDIYMDSNSFLKINNSDFKIDSVAGRGTIEKSGAGILDIKKLQAGSLIIKGATVLVRGDVDLDKNLTIEKRAIYELNSDGQSGITSANTIFVYGKLKFWIYENFSDQLQAQNIFISSATSVLDINIKSQSINPQRIKIFQAQSVEGAGNIFSSFSGTGRKYFFELVENPNQYRWEGWLNISGGIDEINHLALTHNQNQAQSVLIKNAFANELANHLWKTANKNGTLAARKSLEQLSGTFLAEVIIQTAFNSPFIKRGTRMGTEGDFAVAFSSEGTSHEIADQVRNDAHASSVIAGADPQSHAKQKQIADRDEVPVRNDESVPSFWSEVSYSNLNLSHHPPTNLAPTNNSALSLKSGTQILTNENFALGIFISAQNSQIEQEKNKATINSIEGGFYAGIFSQVFQYDFYLSAGQHDIETLRNVNLIDDYFAQAQFRTYSFKTGSQINYLGKIKTFKLKPFIGLSGVLIINEKINEKGDHLIALKVQRQNYKFLNGVAGLRLEKKFQRLNWFAKTELGYLLIGNNSESQFQMSFQDSSMAGTMDTRGLEINPFTYGLGTGFDFAISKVFSFYGSVQYEKNANFSFVKANVGFQIFFNTNSPETKTQISQAQSRRRNAKKTFRLIAASFQPNSAQLSPQAKETITKIADEIKTMHYALITIEGHADITGTDIENIVLSHFRAQTIASELIKNAIPKEKIKSVGLSSNIPIADNTTIQGRQKNRRAEIFVE
jgi:outer membrane protein OmpA-like peptidoglycan-associated protein